MPDPVSGQPHGEGDLPGALAGEIASLYRSGISVPPAIDRAILAGAKAGVARRLRFRRALRWATAGTGAAAAAAAVVWAVSLIGPGRGGPSEQTYADAQDAKSVKEDIDHNGRVDIIDAFVVARRVDAGRQAGVDPAWDVTGDGKVDRLDVDRIAAVAVAVSDSPSVGGGTLQ